MIMFEIIFFSDMVAQFFLSYEDSLRNKPVTDLQKIWSNYLQGNFITDLIPLIPF